MTRTKVIAFATWLSLVSLAVAGAQSSELKPYKILPGGTYTYKPSPEGPGLPGGQPSEFQLDFGVSGTFTVEYDDVADTARLLNVELVLAGNEFFQIYPPDFTPVTADRVEEFLEARLFHNVFVAARSTSTRKKPSTTSTCTTSCRAPSNSKAASTSPPSTARGCSSTSTPR